MHRRPGSGSAKFGVTRRKGIWAMKPSHGLTRREVMGMGVAIGLPAAWSLAAERSSEGPALRRADTTRNIIFMIADGMSTGVPSLAEPFSRLVRGTGTWFYRLAQEPDNAQGLFEMRSLNSLVTDSAAASTAWSSGSRVINGAINVLPDGTKLTPLAPLMRSTRRRVGLVTTTMVAHATPAAFAAVQADRDDMHLIAPQYLDMVDVILGGGREHFDGALRADGQDWLERFAKSGYDVVSSRDGMITAKLAGRMLGVFGVGHLPFTIDRRNSEVLSRTVPTLAEMTRTALRALSSGGDGFLLQVEGGRVDHAAHANDAAALLWDQLAFDDAIGVVMEFVAEHPDTLVVITSDHGNANPGLNGMGAAYAESDACFENLAHATASFDEIRRRVKAAAAPAAPSDDHVIDVLRDVTGAQITRSEAQAVAAAWNDSYPSELNRQHRNFVGVLGQVLGNYNGIGWTGITHTADLVMSLTVGRGRDLFRGFLRNVDAFPRLTRLAGVRHENPQVAPEDARRLAAQVMSRSALRHTQAA